MKSTSTFLYCIIFTGLLLFTSCTQDKPLPIMGNEPIANFNFLNQDSVSITNDTFKGKVYIADFFFTSCTSICPTMHRVMKDIYTEYKDDPQLMFLSHTIDFKYDTPSKLKSYAKKLDVDGKRWQFAYGTKESVYGIAENSYLSAVIEDSTAKENYIHQGYLLLIDKDRRMRGAYDATNKEQVEQLKRELPILLREQAGK
ncbi:MAG: SCO family protein [Pedobacter sp.]|nr:MAG: SCO family protein [Pedobacter sp.]